MEVLVLKETEGGSWLPDQGSNLGPADYNACALDYLITLGMTR